MRPDFTRFVVHTNAPGAEPSRPAGSPVDSAQIERPLDDQAGLDLRLQLGGVEGEAAG